MSQFYHAALQRLGLRQQSYRSVFADGSLGHAALVDLATYCGAFKEDVDGMSHDQIMMMHGRRQAFFRIFKHVKLSPADLEAVSKNALLHAAARLQSNQGVEE